MPPSTDPAAVAWRRQWRIRGFAADRMFPIAFGQPSPSLDELASFVPRSVVLPTGTRHSLGQGDRDSALLSVKFAMAFIAEYLPVQVVMTDLRSELPGVAIQLAVRKLANDELDYLGSFDLLVRIHSHRSGVWHDYTDCEMALDFKMTGASSPFGLNGATMRTYIRNARAVILAARVQKLRVGACRVVAFLIYRPPGFTFDGRSHRGGFGFVAFDADKLCQWSLGSHNNPDYIVMNGTLFQNGVFEPLEPAALPPSVLRAPQRDRWAELRQLMVKPGWVKVRDFVFVFEVTPQQTPKKASQKVLKRLRDQGCTVDTFNGGTAAGQPPKIARIRDLANAHPNLP